MKHLIFLFTLLTILCNQNNNIALAQNNIAITDSIFLQTKTINAQRINNNAKKPKIDGYLEDPVWATCNSTARNFTTNFPKFGQIPTDSTAVKVLYDNEALYIAAFLYDKNPKNIVKQYEARDNIGNGDEFYIGIDTYNDKQNGFRFAVNAAGTQADGKIINTYANIDYTWDAVWFSATQINNNGWYAEIKIPYSAIRFPKKTNQTWRIQFARTQRQTGEACTWSPIDPNKNGILTQWGTIANLKNIEPTLRLAFLPYIATAAKKIPTQTQKPTNYSTETSINGGMDIKYGINESFTLDATLIPDFGQVRSDDVQKNLSPFEIRYNENRPFFTEGTELFNKGELFYSRRIGGTPKYFFNVAYNLNPNEIIQTNPSQIQLLNATKFSGRTNNGLGIGILNAISATQNAVIVDTTIQDTQTNSRLFQTNPLTNYNVFVLNKSLKNSSSVSFINTNVMRNAQYKDANVTGVLFNIVNKKQNWNVEGEAKASNIFEQNNNNTGFSYYITTGKIDGKLNYSIKHKLIDNKFNINDLGILFGNNRIQNSLSVQYNEFAPKNPTLASWYLNFNATHSLHYEGAQYEFIEFNSYFNTTFQKNRYTVGYYAETKPFKYFDYYEPRHEGQKFFHAPYAFINAFVNTDPRKNLRLNASIDFGESPIPHDTYIGGSLGWVWRASPHLKVYYNNYISKDFANFGYITTDTENNTIFGKRAIETLVQNISFLYNFTTRMYIDARLRYYWQQINYHQFYTLNNNGNVVPNPSFFQNFNENFNVFNIDFVYTWEFVRGSFLTLTWKNNAFNYENMANQTYYYNVAKIYNQPKTNSIALKLLYYIDYQKIKNVFDKNKV